MLIWGPGAFGASDEASGWCCPPVADRSCFGGALGISTGGIRCISLIFCLFSGMSGTDHILSSGCHWHPGMRLMAFVLFMGQI